MTFFVTMYGGNDNMETVKIIVLFRYITELTYSY